jgi:uncharacterized protein (UPF0332 family)
MNLREVIERDLKDASIPILSADRRFATAYNAALQAAQMVIACSGYRLSSTHGYHQTAFESAELAMGMTVHSTMAYFDTCRRKRNLVDYDQTQVASETEANELIKKVEEFVTLAEAWIATNHPTLKK